MSLLGGGVGQRTPPISHPRGLLLVPITAPFPWPASGAQHETPFGRWRLNLKLIGRIFEALCALTGLGMRTSPNFALG